MESLLTAVVTILVLTGFSACFSALETALFSIPWLDQQRLKQGGGPIAQLILKTLEKPRELLTTVLLGNELVNVAISILAGGLAYRLLPIEDDRVVSLVTIGVTTVFILIFGEIVPKTVAIRNYSFVSQVLIAPYRLFGLLTLPARWFLTRIADGLVRLLGGEPVAGRHALVAEEYRSMVESGSGLEEIERTLIQNAFDFAQRRVREIMTPAERIIAYPESVTINEILAGLKARRTSRLPIYRNRLDQIVGVLLTKELLPYFSLSHPLKGPKLKELLKPPVFLEPERRLDSVFAEFRAKRIHMGIVRDAKGKVAGLVTMDDLLRQLFP